MIQENEIVMLALGLGVYFFVVAYQPRLERIFEWKLLRLSYLLLLAAWIFTILEGFFLPRTFNIAEHLGYASSTAVLAVWCWKTAFIKVTE
ncbi:MAG: hypothetical protein K9K82_04015 [Desulfobacteraceae bacterium]|nr:hypothetical protein [Desulfobacteraceae bacterium]